MCLGLLTVAEVPIPDMVTALTTDSREVTHGYTKLMEMIRVAGKLFVIVLFTLKQNPQAWWVVALVAVSRLILG